jgi:hypothetical protein
MAPWRVLALMANRARGKFDLVLSDDSETLGFNLANEGGRPAVVSFESSPARTDMTVQNADVARIVDNLDGGMGFSRRLSEVPNGYAYC